MKTVTLFFLTIGLLTLNSCNQKTDTNTMLENSETKTEIFNAIANNHALMTEFMENMQSSEHGMQMMQGNGMQMMIKDSMIMKNMMQSMIKDGKMMSKMMKMMHQEGMMDDDCMQSSMKMLGEKGMNMGDMHNN
jgi:hypothetical protein